MATTTTWYQKAFGKVHEYSTREDLELDTTTVVRDSDCLNNNWFSASKTSNDEGFFEPGEYRVNPYSATRVEYDGTDVLEVELKDIPYPGNPRYLFHTKASGPQFRQFLQKKLATVPIPTPTFEDKLALQRAYSNVDAALLDLGVELGELRETLYGLSNPFKDLRNWCANKPWREAKGDLLQFLSTGRFGSKTGRDAAQAAASTWLEFRFGLRPLLNSIAEGVKLVQEGVQKIDKKRIYSARGFAPRNPKGTTTFPMENLVFRPTYFNAQGQPLAENFVKASASVQYRYRDVPSLSSRFGLNWMYLPELAWELTRLSFVVDRFLGIGPWLSALRVKPYVEILGNTVSVKKETRMSMVKWHYYHYYDTTPRIGSPSDVTVTRAVFNRSVHQELAPPQLISGAYVDFYQTLDHLALLYQNIRF
jgi:hypothetical protein